jgi:hypothetical protein
MNKLWMIIELIERGIKIISIKLRRIIIKKGRRRI